MVTRRLLTALVALAAGGALALVSTLPRVTLSVVVKAESRTEGDDPLSQAITSVVEANADADAVAKTYCDQLRQHPMNQKYNMEAFLATCEQTFQRAIAKERAVALTADPAVYKTLSDLILHLHEAKVPLSKLETTIIHQPAQARMFQDLIRSVRDQPGTSYCEVGFAQGTRTLIGLQTLPPGVKAHVFESDEQEITVPIHDFLDQRFPERLTLYLGDSSVLVPRFLAVNPDVRCGAIVIDGGMDDFFLKDALVDFRDIADSRGHFVAIQVPGELAAAGSVAIALEAAVAKGTLSIHSVVRGDLRPTMAPTNDAEYYADTLVIARFNPLPASETGTESVEVPTRP